MDKDVKIAGLVVFGIGTVLITLMLLLAKDCTQEDDKRLKCVEMSHDPRGCDCLFSQTICEDKK